MFETSHTPTAAYLVAKGHEAKDFVWRGRRCYIEFTDTIELNEDMTALTVGEACVEPMKYSEALETLRNRIFASKPAGVR